MKRHSQFLDKMADQSRGNEDYREFGGRGRVRGLLQVIEDFRRRGMEGQRSFSQPILGGRVGITLRNFWEGFLGTQACVSLLTHP